MALELQLIWSVGLRCSWRCRCEYAACLLGRSGISPAVQREAR